MSICPVIGLDDKKMFAFQNVNVKVW